MIVDRVIFLFGLYMYIIRGIYDTIRTAAKAVNGGGEDVEFDFGSRRGRGDEGGRGRGRGRCWG